MLNRLLKRKAPPPPGSEAAPRRGFFSQTGKMALLRRRMRKDGIIGGAAIAIMLPLAYGVSLWSESNDRARNQIMSQVNNKSNEIARLKQRTANVDQSLTVYERILEKNKDGEIPLDRQEAKEFLQKLSERFTLNSLRLSMSPVTDAKETEYHNAFYDAQVCEIQLTMEALSDEHVLGFLKAMKEGLPGHVMIGGLTLTRLNEITPEVLTIVQNTGKSPLVKADIRVIWYGIKAKAAAVTATPQGGTP